MMNSRPYSFPRTSKSFHFCDCIHHNSVLGHLEAKAIKHLPHLLLGYYSHRETVNGSWYIQDLCEMLKRYGSALEFTELLTLVNRKVSQRRVDFCKDPGAIGKKQVPCFASMLTKKLHFCPKPSK